MVAYIRSDLDFILAQIKVAEKHAAYIANPIDPNAAPLYGVGLAGQAGSVPTYTLSIGLRTVDGQIQQPAARPGEVGRCGHAVSRTARPDLPARRKRAGEFPAAGLACRTDVVCALQQSRLDGLRSSLRTISNLIVDQTLGNPAAILKGLQVGGVVDASLANVALVQGIYNSFKPASDAEYQSRVAMQNAKTAANALSDGNDATPPSAEEQTALDARPLRRRRTPLRSPIWKPPAPSAMRRSSRSGSRWTATSQIPNVSPDAGLSAPFNAWITFFGQFFDHGLDLVTKGGNGTVFIPLKPDDPLYVPGSPTNFMVLTRATNLPGPGRRPRHRRRRPRPVEHHDPVRRPEPDLRLASLAPGVPARLRARRQPVATGKLITDAAQLHRRRDAEIGGMATWEVVKAQARDMLGIKLTDEDVDNVPLLATDAYGNFIAAPHGYPAGRDAWGRRHRRHRGRRPRGGQSGGADRPRPTRCAPATRS